MDKQTLSNYGWVVICVLVLVVMMALATPFAHYVATAVKNTTVALTDSAQDKANDAGNILEFSNPAFEFSGSDSGSNDSGAGTTETIEYEVVWQWSYDSTDSVAPLTSPLPKLNAAPLTYADLTEKLIVEAYINGTTYIQEFIRDDNVHYFPDSKFARCQFVFVVDSTNHPVLLNIHDTGAVNADISTLNSTGVGNYSIKITNINVITN